MDTATALSFSVSGSAAVLRWAIEFAEPDTSSPDSFADLLALTCQVVATVGTGTALLLYWHRPAVARGRAYIATAGVGMLLVGIGHVLVDAFGSDAGFAVIASGAIMYVVCLPVAGILAATADSSHRWSGVFLLLGTAGVLLGPGRLVMGVVWIAFGTWIRHTIRVDTLGPG